MYQKADSFETQWKSVQYLQFIYLQSVNYCNRKRKRNTFI